jgi:glycosyltransferase involved in cell wall biosynthesis
MRKEEDMNRHTGEVENVPGKVDPGFSRLLYAFSYGVAFELDRVSQRSVPTHRLWGFVELRALGWEVELSTELPGAWRPLGTIGWRVWQTLWLLRRGKGAAGIIAVHEISALLLLLARGLGWRGAPVVVLNLGLLHPKNSAGYRLWIWRWLLRKADGVVSLVEAHGAELTRLFGVKASRTMFLPMAVDPDFLGRADAHLEDSFVLAVGTNDGKDFESLLEALPLGVRLVVVTDPYNARKVRNHPCFGGLIEVMEAVSAEKLRELYKSAAVVVIPLADTPHGSGHTVLLETLSMGKIVVVSAARCMRDYVSEGGTALVVPVGDVAAMRAALQETLQHPQRFSEMRERAAAQVRSTFDIRQFGEGLDRMIKKLAVGRSDVFAGENGTSGTKKKKGKKSYASIS